MSASTEQTTVSAGSPRWLVGLVLGVAGLFYAYAIWNAIAHLVSMAAPHGLTGAGWATLLFGAVFPAIVFLFAFAIGRRRNVGELALVMLTGLGIVAVFWMSLLGYSILNMAALTGA